MAKQDDKNSNVHGAVAEAATGTPRTKVINVDTHLEALVTRRALDHYQKHVASMPANDDALISAGDVLDAISSVTEKVGRLSYFHKPVPASPDAPKRTRSRTPASAGADA